MRNYHWLGLCCAALLIPPLMASDDDDSPAQAAASQPPQSPSGMPTQYAGAPGNLPGQASYDPGYAYGQKAYRFPQRNRSAGAAGNSATGYGSARGQARTHAYRQPQSQPQLSTSGWDQRRPNRAGNTGQSWHRNGNGGAALNQNYGYRQPAANNGYGTDYGYTGTGYPQPERNWSSQAYPKVQSTGLNPWDTPNRDTGYSNPKIYGVRPRGQEQISAYSPEWDSGWNGFNP